MTIKDATTTVTSHEESSSPSGVDFNPLSGTVVSMEKPWNTNPGNDSVVSPYAAVREDATIATALDIETATATAASTATTAVATSSQHQLFLEEGNNDNECPMLEGVSIDRLPLRLRRLLFVLHPNPTASLENDRVEAYTATATATTAPTNTVEFTFYPGHIPMPPCCFLFLAAPFAMMLAGILATASSNTNDNDNDNADETDTATVVINGGFWVATGMAVLAGGAILGIGIAAHQNLRARAPLFARGSDGARKPWPGDYRVGTYLVGGIRENKSQNESEHKGLLDYDGRKAWWFPVDSIVAIEHWQTLMRRTLNASHRTEVVVTRSSSASASAVATHLRNLETLTFRHKLDQLEEPRKGVEIRRWHQRCTTRGSNY